MHVRATRLDAFSTPKYSTGQGLSGLIRSLFSSGENGGWYDPSDIRLDWRRNLLTYTEQFDNAAWVKTNSTITANAVVAPDGTLNADKLVENTSTSTHQAYQNYTPTQLSNVVFSVYAKAAERSVVTLLEPNGTERTFNLVTGVATGSGASMVSAGDGWWRCIASGTLIDTATRSYALRLNNGASVTYTGDGTSGIYIWGAQLEIGSTATPYQRITDGIKEYLQYQDQPVLFQNAAGTTPVTAVEQPVGLMLDKSKGLVLGSELAPSSTPDGVGWSSQLTVSVSGNQITFGSQFANRRFSFTSVQGRWYLYTFKARRISGNTSLRFFHENSATGVTTAFTITDSVQTYTIRFQGRTGGGAINVGVQDANASGWGAIEAYDFSVRELPGNHAFNPSGNSANFPVLSARYNLLTKTEQVMDAAWGKNAVSVIGTKVIADNTNSEHRFYQVVATSAANYTHHYRVKAAGLNWCFIGYANSVGSRANAFFNLSSGTVGAKPADATASIVPVGDGSYDLYLTAPHGAFASNYSVLAVTNADNTQSFTGNGVDGVEVYRADLRVSNDALNQPAYQRVNTATDYDTAGFKPYLAFNGVNQWLQTNSIDFTYGDKTFVCAGVRKLSDVNFGIICETSTNAYSNNGSFNITASGSLVIGQKYGLIGNGSSGYSSEFRPFVAPLSNVVSAIFDISQSTGSLEQTFRANANQVAMSDSIGTSMGIGNFGNYPLYIGARGGASLWFNGRLYGLLIRGASTSATQIAGVESLMGLKVDDQAYFDLQLEDATSLSVEDTNILITE